MTNAKFVQNTGILTIVGAVLGIAVMLGYLGDLSMLRSTTGFGLLARILGAIAFTLLLAGIVGVWRSGAVDTNPALAKAGFGLSIVGQVMIIIFMLIRSDMLAIVAGLTLGLGMLLLGIAVLQGDAWESWRKFVPLIYGLSPLVSIFIYPLFESLGPRMPDVLLSAINLVIWLFLGIALWIEGSRLSAEQQRPV